MTTPDFIVSLREKIGHDPLWLVGVTAYVEDDLDRVLLGRRADSGRWALVSGINEPGEDPADTAVREVAEEAGVAVRPIALVEMSADDYTITYANGDQTQYLNVLFLCEVAPGDGGGPEWCGQTPDPRPVDGENLEVGWFDPADLPQPVIASTVRRIEAVRRFRERSLAGDARAAFLCGGRLAIGGARD